MRCLGKGKKRKKKTNERLKDKKGKGAYCGVGKKDEAAGKIRGLVLIRFGKGSFEREDLDTLILE